MDSRQCLGLVEIVSFLTLLLLINTIPLVPGRASNQNRRGILLLLIHQIRFDSGLSQADVFCLGTEPRVNLLYLT